MKNKTILLAFALTTLVCGCAEDKGNYDYTPLNEVSIGGVQGNYTKNPSQNIHIVPQLQRSSNNTEDDLNYEWEINGKIVSRERDLNINLPSDLPYGTTLCRLCVIDKNSGMKYTQRFNVEVVSTFNYGYYFLTESEDKSAEIAYYRKPEPVEGEPAIHEFLHTDNIGGIPLGKEPISVTGKFGYINSLKDYYWTIYFVTKQGKNPVIVTNNATFAPTELVNQESWLEPGYQFEPSEMFQMTNGNTWFICNGALVFYNKMLLYRPAKHNQTYNWTTPVFFGYPSFMLAFDQITHKYYALRSTPNDPLNGIVTDKYAFDDVIPITNCPDLSGHRQIGYSSANGTVNGESGRVITVTTLSSEGVNSIVFGYVAAQLNSGNLAKAFVLVSQTTIPLTGASKVIDTKNDYYAVCGNEIKTSPKLLPIFSTYCDLPTNLGTITGFKTSANGALMVLTYYDPSSTKEYKGSVVFINITTKEQTVFRNVIHKCVDILSANSDTYGWELGDGD